MSVHKTLVTKQLKKRGHFAQVPNEIFAADISVNARLVWVYLISEGPKWDSSVANVANNLGISRSTATNAVKELRVHNMISTRQTKSGTDFTLIPSDQWNGGWINGIPSGLAKNDSTGDLLEQDPVTTLCATVDPNKNRSMHKRKTPLDYSMVGIQDLNTPTLSTLPIPPINDDREYGENEDLRK